MYESILVPTDGSDHAERAGEHAAYLAGAFDATVHLLAVADVEAEAGPFSAGGVGEEYIDRVTEEAEERVQALERIFESVGEVRSAVTTGRPAERILAHADEQGVDLVVMGTHGRTGVQRYVMGSVAERVVSLADVPVLTAHAGEGDSPVEGYDEMLVPTDGSDAAMAAVHPGLAIARRCGARVHAVSVVDVSGVAAGQDLALPPEVVAQLESDGETATAQVAERVRDAGLAAVAAVRQGQHAESLLEYADEHDVDVIAMGTTGRTGLSRYLVGSTTERVIRHAEMPVLAVNARDDTDE